MSPTSFHTQSTGTSVSQPRTAASKNHSHSHGWGGGGNPKTSVVRLPRKNLTHHLRVGSVSFVVTAHRPKICRQSRGTNKCGVCGATNSHTRAQNQGWERYSLNELRPRSTRAWRIFPIGPLGSWTGDIRRQAEEDTKRKHCKG